MNLPSLLLLLLLPLTLALTLTGTTTSTTAYPPGFTLLPQLGAPIEIQSGTPLLFRTEVILPPTKTTILSEISLYSTGLSIFYLHAHTWSPTCHPYAVYCAVGDHYGNAYTFQAQSIDCPIRGENEGDTVFVEEPGFNKTIKSEVVAKAWGPLWGGRMVVFCDARVGEGGDLGELGRGVLGRVGARNVTSDIIF
ncbi:hypothetical protein B0T14DRAFT_495899 [Immersiella caudata]|uniref:Uncharacterized protein n=1 Tax=Immersiella caudata TaxID=314043 RepID=A0AA39WP85_9PEZI|nr:hypothetical protein B0T14DRAFT_495899 [Immersiella caudata]